MGKMLRDVAEPQIGVYKFLTNCSKDDFCRMVEEVLREWLK